MELNSNHMPLFIKLRINTKGLQEGQNQHSHKKVNTQGKILINKEKHELFKAALEKHLQLAKTSIEGKENEEKEYICSSMLVPLIHKALNACKCSKLSKKVSNTFPTNSRFDEECKVAKKSLKEKDSNKENKMIYKQLIK